MALARTFHPITKPAGSALRLTYLPKLATLGFVLDGPHQQHLPLHLHSWHATMVSLPSNPGIASNFRCLLAVLGASLAATFTTIFYHLLPSTCCADIRSVYQQRSLQATSLYRTFPLRLSDLSVVNIRAASTAFAVALAQLAHNEGIPAQQPRHREQFQVPARDLRCISSVTLAATFPVFLR